MPDLETTRLPAGEQGVREAYGASYARLVALKEAWDPQDVFRLNQHIAPRTRL